MSAVDTAPGATTTRPSTRGSPEDAPQQSSGRCRSLDARGRLAPPHHRSPLRRPRRRLLPAPTTSGTDTTHSSKPRRPTQGIEAPRVVEESAISARDGCGRSWMIGPRPVDPCRKSGRVSRRRLAAHRISLVGLSCAPAWILSSATPRCVCPSRAGTRPVASAIAQAPAAGALNKSVGRHCVLAIMTLEPVSLHIQMRRGSLLRGSGKGASGPISGPTRLGWECVRIRRGVESLAAARCRR